MMTKPPRTKPPSSHPTSGKKLPTDPVSEADGALDLPPTDPVTALRVVGRDIELPLLAGKRAFSLGSARTPEVDLTVRSDRADKREHVSGFHVALQRKGNRLWVVDQRSTNGTFVGNRREDSFEVAAGQMFRVGDVTLLALDEHLRALRPHLLWSLGLEAHKKVDETLEVIARGEPLLFAGPQGCDQLALAGQIHRASARSQHAFVDVQPPLSTRPEQTAVLVHASRGTAFVDLDVIKKPHAFFVEHLFGATYHVRPIVSAPDLRAAATHLGEVNVNKLRVVPIPPLTKRRQDVPRLLDALLRRDGSTATVTSFGPEKVDALINHPWPGNLDELRKSVRRLRAVLEHDSIAAAAAALEVTRQSLAEALKRLGLR